MKRLAWKALAAAVAVSTLGATESPVGLGDPPAPYVQHKRFVVPPGKLISYPVSPPLLKTPGRLFGHWVSRGSTAGIKDAQDDCLTAFELRGPDDKQIERRRHPISGNFSVRCEAPGTYTFVFYNDGPLRKSARVVEFDATYHPD